MMSAATNADVGLGSQTAAGSNQRRGRYPPKAAATVARRRGRFGLSTTMERYYRRAGVCDPVIVGFRATVLSRPELYGVARLAIWICPRLEIWICPRHLSVLCKARKFPPASNTE
jgi:hypothetical protein